MKKTEIANLLLAALLIVSAFLIWSGKKDLISLQHNLESRTVNLLSCRQGANAMFAALKSIMTLQWQLEKDRLNGGIMVHDIDGNPKPLDSLLGRSGKSYILYFTQKTCEDCQILELQLTDRYLDDRQVLVLGKFSDFRSFKIYVQANKIKAPAYYMEEDTQLFQTTNPDKVVFFQTDSLHHLSLVHVGSASYPDLSESYYANITN